MEPSEEVEPAGLLTREVRKSPAHAIIAVWVIWIAVGAATWATNARTPLRDLYAVDAAGIKAGAGRALVLLGWPVALVAIAIVAFALDPVLEGAATRRCRRVAMVIALLSVALCATVFVPGVIRPKHLDARPVNVPAAVGVAFALALSIWSLLGTRSPRAHSQTRAKPDKRLLLALVVLLFGALPWLLANLGFYAGDVPGLRDVFMSKQVVPEAGHPYLRAVHLGNHDGFDGLLLVITCVLMIRRLGVLHRLRGVAGAYLSLLLVYGAAVASADWWLEQVVKRGWTFYRIPSLMEPSLSPSWLVIVSTSALIWLALRRHRLPGPSTAVS